MQTIRIKDLGLRIIVGINPDERTHRQDVIINIEVDIDDRQAVRSDAIENTFDYRSLTKQVIQRAEQSEYFLLEKLVDEVLHLVMSDDKALRARVEIDKPGALRYTRSVSLTKIASRPD